MNRYLPDFLREAVTAIAYILLMMTLLQPKYSKKVTLLTMLGILVADVGTATYCYLAGNLTMLAKIDILMFTALCFAVRPLFRDTFMQWLFSYLTVQNISVAVVILSFICSRPLPYPQYANPLLRLVLFGVVLLILLRYVRPLYRQVVKHWMTYFAVALGITITFIYYFLFSGDIVHTLSEQAVPLLLIIVIGVAAYSSIFLSLKNLQREFLIREQNQTMQVEREYLQLASVNMSERLKLMEEVSAQNSRASHDRRHFNNMLMELLEQGENHEAIALLRKQNHDTPTISRVYCDNPTVNAAVCHYAGLSEKSGVPMEIELDVPRTLTVDSLELSMVVSNLMENAITACLKQSGSKSVSIRFICHNMGRLLLEMENPCAEDTMLDENGCPVASQEGHGIGSKSVAAFAKKYNGELIYKVEKGLFCVRLLV